MMYFLSANMQLEKEILHSTLHPFANSSGYTLFVENNDEGDTIQFLSSGVIVL